MQTIIQTPSGNLKESLDFYKKLNFTLVAEEKTNLFSDGNVLLEVNDNRFARAGIKLSKASWQTEIEALRKFTHIAKKDNQYILSDPSGMWIYLIEEEAEVYDISETESSYLGNNAGISLESTNVATSLKIFTILGFSVVAGSAEQGWLSLQNAAEFTISIMKPFSCPHLFFNPSLSFFNGKENNPKVIQKIRDLNIPITEEVTVFNSEGIVDNIIIRDPGGLGFFIFND